MKQDVALGILKTGRNVYLTGAAGAGKTYVLNQYIDYLRQHNVCVGITASTGIAATHLGGMTIHSWSGIGIKDYLSEWDIDSLTQRQALVKRFERTDVLIIDEVSMLRPEVLDMVDQVARAMKRNDTPFGGLQVILSGDFFQLPPITVGDQDDAFVDSSRAWHEGDFRICYLTEQHRQKNDSLLNILNDIRDGEITLQSQEALESRIHAKEIDDDGVVLHTHNRSVDSHNSKELEKLEGPSKVYEMVSNGRANLVESLKKSVLAPERLELKVGARVMFVKNDPDQNFVNGTLGIVSDIDGEYPTVETHDGSLIVAHPMTWETTDDTKILASVSQVPLRLAWAITVHKSQGMSLDAVDVDLSRAFTPGQGYVALSRARTLSGLTLRGLNTTALEVHPYVSLQDRNFMDESARWENIFKKFSPEKIKGMHNEFIDKVGHSESYKETTPTHMKTRALLMEGKSISEIAKERGMTVGTILAHLEKLKEKGETNIFSHLKPAKTDFTEIQKAFSVSSEYKLAPVHKLLKGKYSYEDIRLARLFLEE